jgi:predicted site-specific integrase-resolvase
VCERKAFLQAEPLLHPLRHQNTSISCTSSGRLSRGFNWDRSLYCRVSTDDQCCERQERDLRTFAKRAGHRIVGVYKETASGTKNDRVERKKVMALAEAREIDVILVTELSRWGRSARTLSKLCVHWS